MNTENTPKRTLLFVKGGAAIDFVSAAPGLLIKASQETADIVAKWAGTIEGLSKALIAANLTDEETPFWCISSIQNTITGKARVDAESHANGFALDLAPIYNSETVTAPDGITPNIACDLINLIKLAKVKIPSTFAVVEGDHLHIVEEADPFPDVVITYPTLIPWYNAGVAYENDQDVQPILNKFYKFNPTSMTYAPCSNEEVKIVLGTLTNYRAKLKAAQEIETKAVAAVQASDSPSRLVNAIT